MATETYELVLRQNPDARELVVELRDREGLVETAERLDFEDFELETESDEVTERTTELTTDATRLDLEFQRHGATIEVRVLGDEGTLVAERVDDQEWGLTQASGD